MSTRSARRLCVNRALCILNALSCRLKRMKWFIPHLLTRGELAESQLILEKIQKKNSRRIDDGMEYIEHMKLNGITDEAEWALPESIAKYVACLKRYKHSTRATKVRNVLWFLRRKQKTVTIGDIVRAIDLAAARETIRKAPRVPLPDIVAFLTKGDMSPSIRQRLCFMLLTGLRNVDVNYLQPDHVRWQSKMLQVEVRVAKNRRSPRDRAILTLPFHSSLWPTFSEVVRSQAKLCRFGETAELSIGAVDRTLRKVGATTYSLRRLYVRDVIEKNRRFDGSIDYGAVMQKTMHFAEDTLRAYYEDFADLPEESAPQRVHFLDGLISKW